jgi:predicted dithiol-disulfide oxidoreductase (DUF899 family)
MLDTTYMYLDLTLKGRNELGPHFNLMDWVRHHDRYAKDPFKATPLANKKTR